MDDWLKIFLCLTFIIFVFFAYISFSSSLSMPISMSVEDVSYEYADYSQSFEGQIYGQDFLYQQGMYQLTGYNWTEFVKKPDNSYNCRLYSYLALMAQVGNTGFSTLYMQRNYSLSDSERLSLSFKYPSENSDERENITIIISNLREMTSLFYNKTGKEVFRKQMNRLDFLYEYFKVARPIKDSSFLGKSKAQGFRQTQIMANQSFSYFMMDVEAEYSQNSVIIRNTGKVPVNNSLLQIYINNTMTFRCEWDKESINPGESMACPITEPCSSIMVVNPNGQINLTCT